MQLLIVIKNFKKEHPVIFTCIVIGTLAAVIGAVAGIRGCYYNEQDYIERHTPKLDIEQTQFYYQPFRDKNNEKHNITGIQIVIGNHSRAWAKNVLIDFINYDGYSKYEKVKYYEEENRVVKLETIRPDGRSIAGWLPQGPALSPTIYQNNEKQYEVDVFIDWENDKGERYSLVAKYKSVVDNFNKQIQFEEVYKYDTFGDRKKVKEIKLANKGYLPDDMLE